MAGPTLNTKNKIKFYNFNYLPSCLTSVVHSQHNPYAHNSALVAKGDSGATQHYLCQDHKIILDQDQKTKHGPSVLLPNDDVITATDTGHLNLHQDLSLRAQKAHIFSHLGTLLLSLGQLADDGCIVMLDKAKLHVFKNYKLLLTGTRNLRDGLWDIPPVPHTPNHVHSSTEVLHRSNVIIPKNKTPKTLIQYLHVSSYSPSKTTLLKAVRNGHFPTWPGLTVSNLIDLLDETPATALGGI